jgi:diadenosine tetraphosphate (Ap4A) HIT family hydrolase|tara:strand:+ start:290 stop:658 length:369 start_codon:yes stop_codon:yes gene_type:complete
MVYDHGNIFAKILIGEIPCTKVFENDHALAFDDIKPLAPVHVLIIPKLAYVSIADFSAKASDIEIVNLNRAVGEVAKLKGLVETGYRILANHGTDARQDVFHYHVHLLGGRDLGGIINVRSS